MKNNFFIFIGLVLLSGIFSGCVMWDAGFTPNKPVSQYYIEEENKIPISYSVAINNELDDTNDTFAMPDIKSLRKKIESELKQTGMFSEISYETQKRNDSYHIEFIFHIAGTTTELSNAAGLLAGMTLLLIPAYDVLTFDGAAILYLQGQPIFSSAKAEEMRCVAWLPLAPFGLFMNAWTIGNCLKKGTVNALCEAISQEHRHRFLKNEMITKINAK